MIVTVFADECVWDEFSLQAVEGDTIHCIDIDAQYLYMYTPCTFNTICNGQRYEAAYYNRTTMECLSGYNLSSISPEYTDNDETYSWTFSYKNDDSCNGEMEQFDITWICDEFVNSYNFTECAIVDNNECYRIFSIRSNYACIQQDSLEPSLEPTIEPTPSAQSNNTPLLEHDHMIIIVASLFVIISFILIIIWKCCKKCKRSKEQAYHQALLKESFDQKQHYMSATNGRSKKSSDVQMSGTK